MDSLNINAYLDFGLTRKMEALVINSLPEQSYQSDFNMLYLANIEMYEGDDGITYQTSVECEDTFLMSVVNDFGRIDYSHIKTIHVAGIFESDYESIEITPDVVDINMYANFHEGNPIPIGGGYLEIAYSPFGVTIIEMLNGEELQFFGNGRIWVKEQMLGFKKYKRVPQVTKILSNDTLKIIKLAVYSKYHEYTFDRYSLSIFSPTMKIIKEPIAGQLELLDENIDLYIRNKIVYEENIVTGVRNLVDNAVIPAEVSTAMESNLHRIGTTIGIDRHGFIDCSTFGESIGPEFSIHMIVYINEYSTRGSILFDAAYAITSAGYQTHHITLFLDERGILCYNTNYSDEYISTGFIAKKGMENIITFTVENQKMDEDDDDEFVTFIHVNGAQIWPKEKMYTRTEKIYVWRAMETYRTYTQVCMKLPAPHPVSGGLDSKTVCAKKLLHESGFITVENLLSVYELYLNRPQASKADLDTTIIGSEEDRTIRKLFFGQDSQKDLTDDQYYFEGGFTEIILFNKSLQRDEIEGIHMLNILKSPTIKV